MIYLRNHFFDSCRFRSLLKILTNTIFKDNCFTYVKNMDTNNTGKVSGMLLYAKTKEEFSEPVDTSISGNRILAFTLDLNQAFNIISKQLDSFIEYI